MDQGHHNLQNLRQEEQKYQIISSNRVMPVVMVENFNYVDNSSRIENKEEHSQSYNSSLNSSPKNEIPCSICQIPPTANFIFLESCNHFFCYQCLFEYLKIRIEENQVLTMPCPYDECHSQILNFEIQQTISSELYNKYIRFKNVEELNKQPFLKWCPKPDCEGYDVGSLKKSKLHCNVCEYKYCFYCGKAWHRWRKCKFSEDKEMDKWAKENGIKYCPNCKRKVEKLAGCEHLTCPICKYEWCWVCGDKYIPAHLCNIVAPEETEYNETCVIIFFIFAPVLIFFAGLIFSIGVVYFVVNNLNYEPDEAIFISIRKHKRLSYFYAFFFGLLLNYIIFLLVIWIMSLMLIIKRFTKLKNKICLSILLGTIISPFVLFLTFFSAFISPLIGILLLIIKIYNALKKFNTPRSLNQGIRYGYI